jgi:hypothetical protein
VIEKLRSDREAVNSRNTSGTKGLEGPLWTQTIDGQTKMVDRRKRRRRWGGGGERKKEDDDECFGLGGREEKEGKRTWAGWGGLMIWL